MKTGRIGSLSLCSACWCMKYSLLFRCAHMVPATPPLLWAASPNSSSPTVNLLLEDSISGFQLCPQVCGVKKVQSNYSTSGAMLEKASHSSCTLRMQGLKTHFWKGFQDNGKVCQEHLNFVAVCAFCKAMGCVFLSAFSIPHMKARIGRSFLNMAPSGLLSRSN